MKRNEWAQSAEQGEFVDPFSRLALELPARMALVRAEIDRTETRMSALAQKGMIRAVPKWRISRRKRACLTLVFAPDSDGKCTRKYIGSDPAKIQEALDALDRAAEYDRLAERLYRLMAGAFAASCDVFSAFQALAGYGYQDVVA